MANEEHLAILKQGVEVWNQWRKENSDVEPDLIRAHLIGAELVQANLSQAEVDYDNLNGENKSDKARELVAYLQQRGTIRDLVARCRELCPKVEWEGEYE